MNGVNNIIKLYGQIFGNYINSLFAKPFVILTGNAGTGKTKVALKLANCLSLSGVNCNVRTAFKIGDSFGDGKKTWVITEISNDIMYLSSDENQNRLRPLPFRLIEEYASYISKKKDVSSISSNEERAKIGDLPNAKFDKYMYGFHATLILVAKEYLGRQKNYFSDSAVKVQNHLLIPVGADWTDNTKILGFYNPLKKEYQSTPALDFILLAGQNPEIPFFLILDEMNLSHVERYFSDFLSAMESGEPIPLYKKDADCESSIPEEIVLPKNLFVTGTVNIDETTYMFSPKVLDRANVIEFKPEMDDVLGNLVASNEGDSVKQGGPKVAEGFMELANKIRKNPVPEELKTMLEGVKPVLESVYKILEASGFEFAYRVAKEIRLYAFASYETFEDKSKFNINTVIDQQIVQKILPKIHGNKKQIGTMLTDLKNELSKYDEFKLSQIKVSSMLDKLEKYQYASFI